LRVQICGGGTTSCSTTSSWTGHLLLVVEEEPEPAPEIQFVPAPVAGSI
jgi:hypothetical protein